MKKELKVVPIKNGTVIDHISAGQALNVLRILEINAKNTKTSTRTSTRTSTSTGAAGGAVVSVLMNVRSKKMGRKDIVKVEDRELKSEEVDKIALIAPNAKINIIRDFEVVAKHKVFLPNSIEGIIKCANPNCISNAEQEPVVSRFVTVSGSRGGVQPRFRCFFCERLIEDVSGYL
ncbi:aspartate carbamoyltransferase regulatory subunit [ANME-1 cluster archaeon ex4572_4]|nr:MAG: aspartate carbamoyltransferase regulatory subunit [ANME-1 cluster archaeon ex4572_4]